MLTDLEPEQEYLILDSFRNIMGQKIILPELIREPCTLEQQNGTAVFNSHQLNLLTNYISNKVKEIYEDEGLENPDLSLKTKSSTIKIMSQIIKNSQNELTPFCKKVKNPQEDKTILNVEHMEKNIFEELKSIVENADEDELRKINDNIIKLSNIITEKLKIIDTEKKLTEQKNKMTSELNQIEKQIQSLRDQRNRSSF